MIVKRVERSLTWKAIVDGVSRHGVPGVTGLGSDGVREPWVARLPRRANQADPADDGATAGWPPTAKMVRG